MVNKWWIMKKLLDFEQMNKLTTKRLLAYKNSLYKVPENNNYDRDEVLNKKSIEWIENMKLLKEVLSEREHVEKEK